MRRVVVGSLALVLGACPSPEPPPVVLPPVSTGKVRVRVFTETAAVRAIVGAGKYVFVATDDDVQRWDEANNAIALGADHGLPGTRVLALVGDDERARLWIVTDGGVGYYSVRGGVFGELAAPPSSFTMDYATLVKDGAAIAPGEGGAWIGTSRGLVFVTDKGGWLPTSVTYPVRALLRDRAGWIWMATSAGLVVRKPGGGELVRVGAKDGCEIAQPRLLVQAPNDRVLVIGTDDQGHERIAIGKQMNWATYRALPELAWEAATSHAGGVVVMSGGRVYRIVPAGANTRPLAREGIRLVPLATGAPSDWVIDPLDVALPQGATALGTANGQLLVGTHDLGVARFRDGDPHPRDWLRRKQMFEDATTLSIACARESDCWIATGARQAWHWLGDRFAPGGPGTVVLEVVRDPAGPIYALHRGAQEKEIHLSRIDGPAWTIVPKVALATPGDVPEISFAKFASSGSLWVGLRYREGAERHAYGIAIVEPTSGKIAYHRTEAAAPGKKPKMLPIPVGVVDADVRGDIAWFATNEGVARLANGQVTVWTEADGLRSELARAVTIAPDGGVVVATGAGAGIWNGKVWDFPAALRFEVNDVVATKNGQVWMATPRGIAAWDGKKVRRVDTRRGLAEDEIVDVVADQFDRVWARGAGSLTLISQ